MSLKSKAQVAVISNSHDTHIPFVTRHLETPFLVLEVAAGALSGRSFSYTFNPHGLFTATQGGQAIKNIASVWYRRPSLRETDEVPVPPHLQHYSRTSLDNFERFLWTRFPGAKWVSDPYAMARANDKLLQLEIAHRLGFKIPKTLVTSSPQTAKDFIARTGQVITKPVGARYFTDPSGQHRVFLTRWVTKDSNLEGLHLAPAFFQQAIDVAVDIRVTVVGNQVFAATIRGSQVDDPSSTVRDWRMANMDEKMDAQAFTLPAKLVKQCCQLVKELGLMFGAIDLILDKKGQFWFLENNPDGQWAFIEKVTAQPIGKAIARLLTIVDKS
jgi:glutathione synthase/RimK-type ligase-like ATP-grasp enzyme